LGKDVAVAPAGIHLNGVGPFADLFCEGQRHCDIFTQLHRSAKAKGNLVRDANFAALAIASGSEWITTDRDHARFPGLHWRHPLE